MANELQVRQDGIGGLVEDNPLASGGVTLTSAGLAAMVAIGTTQYAWVIIDPEGIGGAPEHVKVTAHTGGATTATISRGLDGTAARAHDAGTRWVHGPVASDDYRSRLLHVRDEKASGTAGGTFTSGSWQKRTLNTVKTNELGTGLTSDEVTGLGPGVYEVEARCPAYNVLGHKARLYDVTGAAVLVLGSTEYNTSGSFSGHGSIVRGRFTLAVTSTVRLEHRCGTTEATDGFGVASSIDTEVYADLQIRKVS